MNLLPQGFLRAQRWGHYYFSSLFLLTTLRSTCLQSPLLLFFPFPVFMYKNKRSVSSQPELLILQLRTYMSAPHPIPSSTQAKSLAVFLDHPVLHCTHKQCSSECLLPTTEHLKSPHSQEHHTLVLLLVYATSHIDYPCSSLSTCSSTPQISSQYHK